MKTKETTKEADNNIRPLVVDQSPHIRRRHCHASGLGWLDFPQLRLQTPHLHLTIQDEKDIHSLILLHFCLQIVQKRALKILFTLYMRTFINKKWPYVVVCHFHCFFYFHIVSTFSMLLLLQGNRKTPICKLSFHAT